MSADQNLENNKAIVRDFFQKVFIEHQVDAGLSNFRSDYIQHNPMIPTGLEAVRGAFKQGIENVSTDIKKIIAEGDLVVVHHHFKFGPDSLGAAVVDIFRIENGKIAEHWDVMTPVPEKPMNNNSMF
ncbi:MAG: nuclear transport factor 2 family protein [Caulobacteraceae bacterium]|nr:nuclear transport factor 2 family protein [Caulobacteraceae bacterium]